MSAYDSKTNIWHGPQGAASDLHQHYGHYLLEQLQKLDDNHVVQITHETGARLTAAQMRQQALAICTAFKEERFASLQCGDHVSVIVDQHERLASLLIGLLVGGAVVNPLNPALTAFEFENFFRMIKPKIIICERRTVPTILQALSAAGHLAVIGCFDADCHDADGVAFTVANLMTDYADKQIADVPQLPDPAADVALICVTSGTTGTPKGILITHSMVMCGLAHTFPVQPTEPVFVATVAHWQTYFLGLAALETGNVRVISTRRGPADTVHLLDVIGANRVAHVFLGAAAVANIVVALIERLPQQQFAHLRTIQTGGSAVAPHIFGLLREHLPAVRLLVVYGMTDAGGVVTATPMDEDVGTSPDGSVGRVCAHTELIVVADDERRCGPAETGELRIRRPCRMPGYLGQPAATAAAFDACGFLRSGDVGRVDEGGNVFVVDRRQDFIKYRGYVVAPGELEQFVEARFAHAVAACVVVGVPADEEVMGWVTAVVERRGSRGETGVPDVTAAEIADAVAANFHDSKRLRGGVWFVERLPRTVTGKVQKNRVRQMAIEFYEQRDGGH